MATLLITPAGGAITGAQIASALGAETGLTAHAGGTQAAALALSSTVFEHRISTTATAGDSVILPAATAGTFHFVRNDGVATMQLYAALTETINGIASATGIAVPTLTGILLFSPANGTWVTIPNSSEAETISTKSGSMAFSVRVAGQNVVGFGRNGTAAGFSIYGASTTAPSDTNAEINVQGSDFKFISTQRLGWSSSNVTQNVDVGVARAGAQSIVWAGQTPAAGAVTSRTEINKAVTAIADAVATATFTVTIPNAAHSAMLFVTLCGSLGAGGAIGANEATGTVDYEIAITRTAGVNAVAVASAAVSTATASVAGGAIMTIAAALSAISGAVGATNTFTVNVTISRLSGAATNHTCFCYARLLNANATGVTIA